MHADTRLQSPEGMQPEGRPRRGRIQPANRPDGDGRSRGESEARRHYADDRMLLAIERQRTVQHVRIGIQMVPPELLADHDHTGCARTVFPGMKSASFQWGNAKDRKEIRAHAHARNPFRRSIPLNAKLPPAPSSTATCSNECWRSRHARKSAVPMGLSSDSPSWFVPATTRRW